MRTVIRMTKEQNSEIKRLKTFGAAWFERLADITECPPEVLRRRFPPGEALLRHEMDEKTELEEAAKGWPIRSYGNHMFVVVPVPQEQSGVMVFVD